jgi:hypothetical protein
MNKEPTMLTQFLLEHCLLDPTARVDALALYAAFRAYCAWEAVVAEDHQTFCEALTERGFTTERDARGNDFWVGLRLHEPPDRRPGQAQP